MGKIEKNKLCPICDSKLGFLKHPFKDGIRICNNCFRKTGLTMQEMAERGMKNISIEELQERMEPLKVAEEELKRETVNFVITKRIGNFVAFDEEQQKWAVMTSSGSMNRIYKYSDIVNFELIEDGESVATGGLGRALVGGALFGGVGAIVGGVTGKRKSKAFCSNLKLKVTIKDMKNPVVYLDFINTKMKKDGNAYKTIARTAQECLSIFQLICDKQKNESNNTTSSALSTADEIKKFKELLDEGVITNEEFDKKKKELLGI
ncbi:SHOCT domain-containing protein [Sporosarcina sp. Te-1]|uniref:SHOCT domain-containing protein n=1 Tax=Sporosarcina sp. Te-1 TaxID=2818390 RepID=UPI001A9D42FB|nr:SHOCT domain-containing protein [Sporosarcina sp. Te-1]QTD41944.1 SHOCT domain-containing protein [Sporosarcina sp. Te-1]